MEYSGFDCLFPQGNDMDAEVSRLENESNIKLPESYKRFMRCYRLGKGSLNKQNYLDSDINMQLPLISYSFNGDSSFLEMDAFLDVETALQDRPYDDNLLGEKALNLMQIAYTSVPSGGGVYIGLNPDNHGKVYKVDWDGSKDNGAIVIADDVFDFVSKLKSKQITANGVDFSKLYKNWGEDFWRVKK
ncbi:MAG: SMI1/KNR4 family protein [Bacteroidota bacterium]